jgi:spore photoproduct lyase
MEYFITLIVEIAWLSRANSTIKLACPDESIKFRIMSDRIIRPPVAPRAYRRYQPAAILVDAEVLPLARTRYILERCPGAEVRVIEAQSRLPKSPGAGQTFGAELTRGKRTLYLTRNQGLFYKPCPATREYRCCDYRVLNIGMNCPMECVYCILQAYLNNPWLSFFVNNEDLWAELTAVLDRESDRMHRIGTGEFTDSLVLDHLTGLSRDLVEFMAVRENAVLELKTKTANIENLRDLRHRGRTITAWSLNSTAIMAGEELKTASLAERLAAAASCADWGYRLAFHFDPVIHHDNWREGYRQTIRRLFATVPAERIAWISLGALRFLPALKPIATSRFPGSRFFYDEFVPGLDQKFRYFRSLRVEMYQFVYRELSKQAAPSTCIYLCMESDEIWREVFGFAPEEQGGLPAMLDRAAGVNG